MLATWALHGQSFIYLVARQHLAEPHYFKSTIKVVYKVILSSISPSLLKLRAMFHCFSRIQEKIHILKHLFSNSRKAGYCRWVWLAVWTRCTSFAGLFCDFFLIWTFRKNKQKLRELFSVEEYFLTIFQDKMEHALISPQLALGTHQHDILKPKIDSDNDEKVTVFEFENRFVSL